MAAKTSPITPSVLAWALRQDGRSADEIAETLKVEPSTLAGWISAEARPSVGQVSELARALHRPRAFFFLPAPPAGSAMPSGFRRPPGGGDKTVGAGALLEVRRAKRLQQAVVWATRDDSPPNVPLATQTHAPTQVAARVRDWLGVLPDELWSNDYAALRRWRTAIEDVGILVFALQLGKDEVRGFASWDERAPMIVLNTSQIGPAARSFTLGHELAHLVLRQATACLEPADLVIDTAQERWCEEFSAALLMPTQQALELVTTVGVQPGTGGIDAVRAVMNRFRVSARAAALRLQELGYAKPGLYAEVLRIFRPKPRKGEPRSDPRPTLRLRQYGEQTVSLLLGSLPPTEALSVLRITVDDARRIADEVPGVPAF